MTPEQIDKVMALSDIHARHGMLQIRSRARTALHDYLLSVDAPAQPKGLFVDMIAEQGPKFVAEMAKIGCIQHDCDECKARLAQPVAQPTPERNKHWHDTAWARGHAMGMIANQEISRSATQALEAERAAHMETNRMMTEALMQAESSIAQPKQEPLTQAQRSQVFDCAETSMRHNPYLSWRDAICDALESAHRIGDKK